MRTKKEIRSGEKKRKTLGISLIVISIILLLVGYLMLEYKPSFIVNMEATSIVVTVIVSVIWFVCDLFLFFAGILIIFGFKIRHQDYEERKYSSRV